MNLRFQVHVRVQKPVGEVFDAVYDPNTLSRYFITGGASGPPEEGKTVKWQFADFPGEFPVFIKKVVPGKLIGFEWESVSPAGEKRGYNTNVAMSFESAGPGSTVVKVEESGWEETQEGLDSSYGNCHGWTQMLSCLKAYLEYGINLRKDYF